MTTITHQRVLYTAKTRTTGGRDGESRSRTGSRWVGPIAVVLVLASAPGCRRTPDNQPGPSRCRAGLQHIPPIDKHRGCRAGLAGLVAEPGCPGGDTCRPLQGLGQRAKGYLRQFREGVSGAECSGQQRQHRRGGRCRLVVYDFVFTAKRADGQPFTSKGWESHGYQRTANGWRIAHLHYSVPPPRA